MAAIDNMAHQLYLSLVNIPHTRLFQRDVNHAVSRVPFTILVYTLATLVDNMRLSQLDHYEKIIVMNILNQMLGQVNESLNA